VAAACGGGSDGSDAATTTAASTAAATATAPDAQLAAARDAYAALAARLSAEGATINRRLERAERAGDLPALAAVLRDARAIYRDARNDLAAIDFPAAVQPKVDDLVRAAGRAEVVMGQAADDAAGGDVAALRALGPELASSFGDVAGSVAVVRDALGLPQLNP
jgi:hypothetical protein